MGFHEQYTYYYCLGRQLRRSTCQQPYMSVEAVEKAVEGFYASVRMPADMVETVRDGLRLELGHQHQRSPPELAWAKKRVAELEQERRRLAHGVITGAIPGDLVQEE